MSPELFNEERYKQLMTGLECSEVLFSNAISLTGEQRLDSEYYSKEFIINTEKIRKKGFNKFHHFCNFIRKGIFDLSPNNYLDEGIPFIRITEIKNCLLDFSSTVYISEHIHRQNQQTQLLPNDLLFTKIWGYIGDVALLPKRFDKYNFSQNVAGASIIDKSNSSFLLFFFYQ